MEIIRHVPDAEAATRTVLCDSPRVDVWWDWARPDVGEHRPGAAVVVLDGQPAAEAPAYRYLVRVGEAELGEMLAHLPVEAVPLVIGGLLRGRDPEVLGAVVGRIIAHVAGLAQRAERRPAEAGTPGS